MERFDYSGWANGDATPSRLYIAQRFQTMQEKVRAGEIQLSTSFQNMGYRVCFKGTIVKDSLEGLTCKDILILMDEGNLCFGGKCVLDGKNFSGHYYTD